MHKASGDINLLPLLLYGNSVTMHKASHCGDINMLPLLLMPSSAQG